MLVDKFKDIAESLNWFFNYGDYSWQNLNDLEDDTDQENQKINFLLLWKDADKKFNGFNALDSINYEGEFILAVRSKLDDIDHNSKYEQRIKKVEDCVESFTNKISVCDNMKIISWKETEVTNDFDTNVDGLKIRFRILYEL